VEHVVRGKVRANCRPSAVLATVAPDSYRTHTKLHIGLSAFDAVRKGRYEEIYVVPSPAVNACKIFPIDFIGPAVWQGLTILGVGIKIIVKMNSIYIVIADHFHDHPQQIVPDGWNPGIEIDPFSILEGPLGMFVDDILGAYTAESLVGDGAKRIHPGVKFHVALVALFDHEFQGIIVRARCEALGPTDKLRPGSKARLVKGISAGPHLYHHGIHPIGLLMAEQADKFFFLVSTG